MNFAKSYSLFSEFDIQLFKAGKHYTLYEKFGSHCVSVDGQEGVYFAVWAPSAYRVSLIGDFNYWDDTKTLLNVRWDSSGIWEGFVPGVKKGQAYKYKIYSNINNRVLEKADPFAFYAELRPKTASLVWGVVHKWKDKKWMNIQRAQKNNLGCPFSVYEVHLGSWKKNPNNDFLTYAEMITDLVPYVKDMGFTHVEFMPVMEHPYDPSWGYQITGYFAPTSRFGTPQEFMRLVEAFHLAGIGVFLDWVPSHFPEDAHGLAFFDGSALYEHPSVEKGFHPDWKSMIFNYERNEVRSFLISNALFWLDYYHIDGLRVDAVASMLYLDYSRKEGEWHPNIYGKNEYLEAVSFLKEMNEAIYHKFHDVQIIAEESTSFPMVSKPVYLGGLGFGMKWMMGWMNDTLCYFKKDPIHRKYYQGNISFSLIYAFTENFMLPFSHDEVVHGKGSILSNMPGDEWQKFANLRLLYGYMFTHPGTKLLFMGNEIGQYDEWDFKCGIQWNLLKYPVHHNIQKYIRGLNMLYQREVALYEKQFSADGFEWIIYDDDENSVLAYIRRGLDTANDLIIVCNLTPVVRHQYRIGLPRQGQLLEVFNSDEQDFGGSGLKNQGVLNTSPIKWNLKNFSVEITLPPMALTVLKYI